MITPAIMLVLLVTPLAGAAAVGRSEDARRSAAAFGLTLVFLFTGVGHFIKTAAMAEMIPPFVPQRVPLIYLTGILEIAAALALTVPRHRRKVGWLLLAMLIGLTPFNVYAAIERVPMGGHEWGPVYLLVRIPLQLMLILWTYGFVVRPGAPPR